jgi:[acyl-carrier-protein] S-malonyltransferase
VDAFALVLGHSLGEISALTVAGALAPDAAFDLVVRRGELCKREARRHPGTMVAVLGLDMAAVEYARRLATRGTGEPLDLACANSATQFVLSGTARSADAFVPLVAAEGGLVKPLPIPGAYHSPAMAGAVDEFAAAVRGAGLRPPRVRLLSAIDGCTYADVERLDRVLARALVNPVRWRDAVLAAKRAGITTLVETGPGRTLAKLARYDRILPFERSGRCS